MVEMTRVMGASNRQLVCVFADTMDGMPAIQKDLEQAGAIVELVSGEHLLRDIFRLYKKYHPVVVDVHFYKWVKLYTAFFSALYGAKHFTHVHSLLGDVSSYKNSLKSRVKRCLWGMYYWLLTKTSKQVICISEAINTQFRQWAYGVCDNVSTIYLGTQLRLPTTNQTTLRRQLYLNEDAFILANVSAIEHIKGIDLILSAMALLKQDGKNMLFVHIGGLRGDTDRMHQYEQYLHRMVNDLHLQDNVIWLGRRSDVQQILPFADVYVHPSRSEGLGSALLEASLAGLPCVGSKVGGIPEVIRDGETGILVDNENIEQLVKALSVLYDDAELRRKCGNAAQEYVIRCFDQNKQALELVGRY